MRLWRSCRAWRALLLTSPPPPRLFPSLVPELEKFKFVLDYKIKDLKRQLEPRELEIADMKDRIKEMDTELERYHKSQANLDLVRFFPFPSFFPPVLLS